MNTFVWVKSHARTPLLMTVARPELAREASVMASLKSSLTGSQEKT
jgi:hypothetical protein